MVLTGAKNPRRALARIALAAVACASLLGDAPAARAGSSLPLAPASERRAPASVLVITVDTLRLDRLSAFGYRRPTSPNIDRLLRGSVSFTQARTVEPLTSPALVSMWTSLYPHEHGATRNGLRMRAGVDSLPRRAAAAGYRTAAFVGSWTLRDKLSGLAEHFQQYDEVLTRKRWLGLVTREATGEDLTEAAGGWLTNHARQAPDQPFLAWVHYVEPHAPYRLHAQHLAALGLTQQGQLTPSDRYDTEVVEVDRAIGALLATLERTGLAPRTLVVFASDHGESLGEHDYWGHGRHLYEPCLRIPMAISWPGRLAPRTVDTPALNMDLAPTLLSLLGLPVPGASRGFDWSPVLSGAAPPADRLTWHQAHRGVVLSKHDSDSARRSGLLEVALVRRSTKEILRLESNRLRVFDLSSDPRETRDLNRRAASPSEGLLEWMRSIYAGLNALDTEPVADPDPESLEALRSLGYVE